MVRAVMLIKSGGRVPKAVNLARELKRMACVSDAFAIFGRFDVVAFFENDDVRELFRSISRVTKFTGLMSTETLVEAQGNQPSREYGRGPFSH